MAYKLNLIQLKKPGHAGTSVPTVAGKLKSYQTTNKPTNVNAVNRVQEIDDSVAGKNAGRDYL